MRKRRVEATKFIKIAGRQRPSRRGDKMCMREKEPASEIKKNEGGSECQALQ